MRNFGLYAKVSSAAVIASLFAGFSPMNDGISVPSALASSPARPEATGYFAEPSILPFYAPDFTKISDSDYQPAMEQAMALHNSEIAQIVNNPDAPTFDNTILTVEQSGKMLNRVITVFYALVGANTNDTLDAIDTEMGPKLSSHYDAINLNPQLFARVKAVYDQKDSLNLGTEESRLLEKTYEDMVHAGALLTQDQKEQVKQINNRLSAITTEFSQKVRSATVDNALIVDRKEDLAGLSDSEIDAAAKLATEKGAEGKFAIALQNTTQQPLLPSLDNRNTREQLFEAGFHRAEKGDDDDSRALIAEIVQLRAKKAALFGAPDWASYIMYDRMAQTPATAIGFMENMVPALSATQRLEAEMLNEQIRSNGENFTVEPWDWSRYADQVRQAKFNIDESAVKPYFQVTRVLEDGVFYAANRLYGLNFVKRTDLPVYHPDVTVYTVVDRDGSELGLFYFDPFQRPSKRGGAWMGNFVEQSHLNKTKPVIYNVLNIPKAPDGEPQLVSFDNVETMFHEFGHALHGLFANQQYESLSGTEVARDFVEYPSQVNEMWASDPEVLAHYARHYQTGEPIPMDMVHKIHQASTFNQGYELGEVVEAALLDMKWHALSPDAAAAIDTPDKVSAYENDALKGLGLEVSLVPPRYRSSYFNHIFSSSEGYSAGYYSYLWTEMLDRDSRQWFRENGGLTRENGDHFRDTVLSRGGTMDYDVMYRNFTGRDPGVEAMLEARGLKTVE